MIVRTTRRAKADIRALFKLIRSYDHRAAISFTMRLNAGLRTLSDHPLSGPECPEFGPGVRRKVIGLTLVLYQVNADHIVVLRALDGRMDVETEFLK
jgi:toxin ParE1/3/4